MSEQDGGRWDAGGVGSVSREGRPGAPLACLWLSFPGGKRDEELVLPINSSLSVTLHQDQVSACCLGPTQWFQSCGQQVVTVHPQSRVRWLRVESLASTVPFHPLALGLRGLPHPTPRKGISKAQCVPRFRKCLGSAWEVGARPWVVSLQVSVGFPAA